MKKVVAAAALAAAMLTGTAVGCYAAIVPTGVVDPTNGNFAGTAPTGTFTQYFEFTIPLLGSYTVDGSLTTSPGSAVTFSAFDFTNLNGTPIETGTEGITLNKKGQVVPDPKNWTLGDYTFKAGNYFVEVMGTGAKGAPKFNYGFTGNLSITMNPVPLPASAALFGLALAGLGVAGAMRRKGQVAV